MWFSRFLPVPSRGRPRWTCGVLGLLALGLPIAARAQWQANGVPLCTASGSQGSQRATPDGMGGAIVVWHDLRAGTYHIYAQRVNAEGVRQWTSNGVPLCTSPNGQFSPTIVADGAGGAIVTWWDYRNNPNDADIYAQRVDGSGVSQWTSGGIPVCTTAGTQRDPLIVTDGEGGAIIVWHGPGSIGAQRVNSAGVLQWAAGGVSVNGYGTTPWAVSDGAGGAIVAWQIGASPAIDVYAQRIGPTGARLWATDGAAVCTATNQQESPALASDGSGGAIIAWRDNRSGRKTANYDIYAQRINGSGVAQWVANGVALCVAADQQVEPIIASDRAGGAIVAWSDLRSGVDYHVYARRVTAAGVPSWTADGVAVCTVTGNGPNSPMADIIPDGSGGAILAWTDQRNASEDVFAQRVSDAGVPSWAANGIAVCTAAGNQLGSSLAPDGAGGAVVSWWDWRSGDTDIYAHHLACGGSLGGSARPHVEIAPGAGPAGTVFSLSGRGFTPDHDVEVRFARPDGSPDLPNHTAHTDGCGAFGDSYDSSGKTAYGTYSCQAVELDSGRQSEPGSFFVAPALPPSPPGGLAVLNLGTGSSLRVSWAANPGSEHVVEYRVYRSSAGQPLGLVHSTSSLSFEDQGLERGREYAYSIAAWNGAEEGARSTAASRSPDYYPVLLVHGFCSDATLWTDCGVAAQGVTEVPDCRPAGASRLGDVLRAKGLGRVWVVGYDRNKRLYQDVPEICGAIDQVMAATGEAKVNIVAHSQGGLICRSVLQTRSSYRSKVDNLVMLGTPNHGSAIANLAVAKFFTDPVFGKIKASLACIMNSEAVYDLVPGSGFLQQLNYGTEPCHQSHRCDTYLLGSCSSHEAEDLPRDESGTRPVYWLMAGTGQWCGLEQKISGIIGCAPNDGVVGLASARLQALAQDHWTTDKALDPGFLKPRASHYGLSAGLCHPEEVRYGVFADATWRILSGAANPLSTTPNIAAASPQAVESAADSLETSFLPSILGSLTPGALRRDTVVVDSCAEVGFLQSLDLPGATLELVSPAGRRLAAGDTVTGAVRYSRNDALVFQELTVPDPEPGSWIVESQAPPGGPDQGFELLTSVVAGAALKIDLQGDEPTPGTPLSIRAWLDLPSGADATASLTGVAIAPDSSATSLSFHDDGAHGDGMPADGVFGATYTPALSGAHGLSVQAVHGMGTGSPLSRARTVVMLVEVLPDLAVAAEDVTVRRSGPGGPDDSLSVSATIRNLAGTDATGARVSFLGSSGAEFHHQLVDIPGQDHVVVEAIWTPAHPDLDTLVIAVDANAAFLQQRYDNDTARVILAPNSVRIEPSPAATEPRLARAYPNPMSASATIVFSLPSPEEVSLRVYDVAGRAIRTLVEGKVAAGPHTVRWDGRSADGARARPGMYFCRLRVGPRSLASPLVLLR